jgi:hypothetical protein
VRDRVESLSLLSSAAIIAASCGIFFADGVAARGPNVGSPYDIMPGYSNSVPKVDAPAEITRPARPRGTYVAGRPVCVRLCDGAFFPIATPSASLGEEAACQGLCPDAPTAVYREPKGSDNIDGALSTAGKPYTALPAAFRYQTTLDRTCTCHRDIAPHYSVAQDATLRKGDYVMTPDGFVVFNGAGRLPHGSADFTAIANAKISARERVVLQAMEGSRAASLRASIRIAP